MTDMKQMLAAIINGQSALKQELIARIDQLDQKLSGEINDVKNEVQVNTDRINNLGLQLAKLEDDAPTREEFDAMDQRIQKVEIKVASV
jgi:hypothetical protein